MPTAHWAQTTRARSSRAPGQTGTGWGGKCCYMRQLLPARLHLVSPRVLVRTQATWGTLAGRPNQPQLLGADSARPVKGRLRGGLSPPSTLCGSPNLQYPLRM